MTPEQTAADNALVEKLEEAFQQARYGGDGKYNPDGDLFDMAAERIKSLLAERDATERERRNGAHLFKRAKEWGWPDDGGEGAFEFATRIAYEHGEADRQRMREALEVIERTPAWGYPDKWETTPAEVRQLARRALNPASKEANDA